MCWWLLQVDLQAMDRAHRIGQTKQVRHGEQVIVVVVGGRGGGSGSVVPHRP